MAAVVQFHYPVYLILQTKYTVTVKTCQRNMWVSSVNSKLDALESQPLTQEPRLMSVLQT